jgi:hypothetical protein
VAHLEYDPHISIFWQIWLVNTSITYLHTGQIQLSWQPKSGEVLTVPSFDTCFANQTDGFSVFVLFVACDFKDDVTAYTCDSRWT